jgi:hypothetical protein
MAETLRGSLFERPSRVLFIIRAVDPSPDLAAALRAVRRLGAPTKVLRGWSSEGGRLRLSFEVLEPEPCRRRAFYVPAAPLDAFLGGCAVGIDTDLSGRRHPGGTDVLPVWPTEGPRLDVLEALTEAIHDPWAAMRASPWAMAFNVSDRIKRPTTPDVAIWKPTPYLLPTSRKDPKRATKAHLRRRMSRGHR